jgi:limonene-1,2-epoxide hydrolase
MQKSRGTIEAFRAAVAQHDLDAVMKVFADEVTFHSPIVFKPYHGKDELRFVLSGVMQVLEDLHYVGEYRSDEGVVLHFHARVGDREVDGVDMLHLRSDGLCDDFTVMVRPYSAASLLRDRMAALLEAAG